MSNFRVGEKVVCIDPYCVQLQKDTVYTVEAMWHCCRAWVGLALVRGPHTYDYCVYCDEKEPCAPCEFFEADAFRPLDSLEEALERIEEEPI